MCPRKCEVAKMRKQSKPTGAGKPDGKLKGYFKNMKTVTKVDYATYAGVVLAFVIVMLCQSMGLLSRSITGMLVPICCYICMSLSIPIWALRYARPASVSVINLAGPVFTVFTGFFLLGEVPTLPMYLGAAIMILGLGFYVLNEQKEALRVKH